MNGPAPNRTPRWAWALIGGIPCLPVLVQLWTFCCPPQGTVATGLSIGDTVVFTHCLRMFETGFFMPYASAQAPEAAHHAAVYLVPLHAVYGIAGWFGHLVHLPELWTLNIINTLAGSAYLYAAYRLMTEIDPRLARVAFLLFALGGGLGGWAYLFAHITGWDASATFEADFMRFARYELIEGARFAPSLAVPRLYYTLALAGCLGGLAAFIRWQATRRHSALALACGLLAFGPFLNIRLGPPLLLAGILLLLVQPKRQTVGALALEAATLSAPVVGGCAAAWSMYMLNPALVRETVGNIRSNMAFSAFLAATCFHWLVLPGQVKQVLASLSPLPRILLFAGCGYLATFALLYVGYQVYYGTLANWVDFNASVAVSDWALIGAVAGAVASRFTTLRANGDSTWREQWMVLWLLALTVAALAAFGHGWYIRFTPDRLMAFMGVPLSMAAAAGIARVTKPRPQVANTLVVIIVAGGVCSTGVAWTVFQGPLGYRDSGPFAWTHAELMSAADARLLKHVKPGKVMAPVDLGPCMGDVATMRPGVSTVFGYGSFAFSDRPINEARAEAEEFYAAATEPERRLAIARKWGLQYVLCPDTHPVADAVVNALRQEPWLREIARDRQGVLFETEMETNRR